MIRKWDHPKWKNYPQCAGGCGEHSANYSPEGALHLEEEDSYYCWYCARFAGIVECSFCGKVYDNHQVDICPTCEGSETQDYL